MSLFILLGFGAGCSPTGSSGIEDALSSYSTLGRQVSWPGFDPAETPIALFDGRRTYLIHHPSPPPQFRPLRRASVVFVADTAFDALAANTDVEFAGARMAVVLIPPDPWSADSIAALMIHEAFHVHQSLSHPDWTANEVDLFTYPIRSVALLHRRRIESGTLRRAVSEVDSVRRLCWGQAFLRARRDRFSRLPEQGIQYERGTELREGLARYVEGLASGAPPPAIPAEGFTPEDVRERAYETGRAIAILLDRTGRAWKDSLVTGGAIPLDSLLEEAIASHRVARCGLSPDEIARAGTVARTDIEALAIRDRSERDRFETAPGWMIEILGDAEPLFPARFDPLNVRVLDERHVLHTRWLTVSSASITAEVLGRSALTRGLPGHPLFNGLDRVWISGLTEPRVETHGDTTRIAVDGLSITAVGATIDRDGQRISVRVDDTATREGGGAGMFPS